MLRNISAPGTFRLADSRWGQAPVNNPANIEHFLGRDAALDVFNREHRLYKPGSFVGFQVPRSGEDGVVDTSRWSQPLVNNPANMEHRAGVHWLEKSHQGSEDEIRGAQKDLQLTGARPCPS